MVSGAYPAPIFPLKNICRGNQLDYDSRKIGRHVLLKRRFPAAKLHHITANKTEFADELVTCLEAGLNTSTVALRVVGGDEKGSLESETIKYGYESHGTRTRGLARASSNCKQQTRPLVRESAPHQQTRNCLRVIKIWS
jgi:hypothetical protein